MKINKNKILMSLLVGGLIVGLTTPNIIKANELDEVKEDEIIEVEESPETEKNIEADEVVENNDFLEVEDTVENTKEKEVDPVIPFVSSRVGVPTLTADVTTLGEVFPDENFRKYVAETVLNKTSGTYSENTVLSSSDITLVSSRTNVNVANGNISSLKGIEHFTNMNTLYCQNNQLTSLNVSGLASLVRLDCYNNQLIELDISGISGLRQLRVYSNKLSGSLDLTHLSDLTTLRVDDNNLVSLDVSGLTDLTLIYCHNNNLTNLNVSGATAITTLQAQHNEDLVVDLSGLNSIQTLFISKATNVNLDTTSMFKLSGSREYGGATMRLDGALGFATWDTMTTYYVINSGTKYAVNLSYINNEGDLRMKVSDWITLSDGGIMDNEGNLVVGASLSNVSSDGTITLENGGLIMTGEGTFTFEGSVSIKDGVITTNANYGYEKKYSYL